VTQNLFAPQAEENGHLGYYEGRMRNLPALMVGKIFLTPKYLGFHAYEVRSSGLFRKAQLVPSGKVLGIAMDKVVEVSIEAGVRSKKSRPNWKDGEDFEKKASGEKPINARPKPLDGREKYRQMMVTCETDDGLEVAMFEVADPQLLVDKMKNLRQKPKM
jgi:hypothetical protein